MFKVTGSKVYETGSLPIYVLPLCLVQGISQPTTQNITTH